MMAFNSKQTLPLTIFSFPEYPIQDKQENEEVSV